MLPFGCRSSPFLFCSVSNALLWIIQNITHHDAILCYVDGLFFINRPASDHFLSLISRMLSLCTELGVPVASEKTEWPDTARSFLGICLNSVTQIISLPVGKYNEIMSLVCVWREKSSCSRTELQSLIGSLQFAAKCVPAGRLFIRRLLIFLAAHKPPLSNC